MENMLQDVRQVYARYLSQHFGGAREGDAEFALQERYFHKNYLPHLPQNKNARIIDLGCGLGHFLYFMKRAGYINILGVDVGKECIEFCKRKKLPVHEAEISEYLTTLLENSVDAFILNDVLEHQTKDRIWTLLELIRTRLKPNGTFLVKVPNMGNPLLGNDGRYIDITHEIGFDQHSLKQTLLMAKFNQAQVLGTDIYVTKNPLLNAVALTAAYVLNTLFYLIFKLYGRTDTTIFTKNILGIAHK